MKTVVTARVPAAEFALSTTFEALPEVEAEVDPIIESGDETMTPVVRMRGVDRETLDEALAADPSVDRVSPLSYQGEADAHSYHVDWSDDVHRVLRTFTAANGGILDIIGQHDHWRFRVRYPRRENLLEAHEHWMEQGVTVDIERIHEVDSPQSTDADFAGV